MTIPEEIEQLKAQLTDNVDEKKQPEILLDLLKKYISINGTDSQPFIDRLLQLAEKLNEPLYKAWGVYHLAVLQRLKGNYDVSMDLGQQTLSLFEQIKDRKGIAATYNNIGHVYLGQDNYNKALKSYLASLKLYEEISDKQGSAHAFNNIGIIYEKHGNLPKALKNHFASLKIMGEIAYKPGMASSYANIGNVYSVQGNYPESLKNYFAGLKISEETGNKKGIASSYGNIGGVYYAIGNYPESLKNHLASLKLHTEILDKLGIAASSNNMGTIYLAQGNYPEALKNYFDALKISEEIEDKFVTASSYNNIGIVYYEQGNYPEALKNHFAALKLREEIGDKQGITHSYNNIGIIYEKQGNYLEALKHHFDSLKLSEEIGYKYSIAGSFMGIAAVYHTQGNYAEALKNQLSAIKISEEIGNKDEIKESALSLTYIYKVTGDFENALKYHEKYHQLESEILGEQAQKQLTNLSFQHNLEQTKKQSEIDRLKIIELQNEISDVEMKALRAQMNPHFIFNSLNSINRFIQLNNTDDASEYLIKFSKLMRLILDNSRHKEVLIQKDLEALRLYMELESARMDHKFAFEIKIGEGVDPETMMIPPLILQPFVENAIWHGMSKKEGSGKIAIGITRENDMISCVVQDNGIGREKAMALKSSRPEKKHESLGMKLTHDRISILNRMKKTDASIALIDLYDKDNNALGTRVEVKLPLELCF